MRERNINIAIYTFFVILAACLFYTQILRYPYYYKLARNNAIRIIPIDGPRGNIFDRNNIPLVTNRLSFDVAVVYQELKNREKLIELLTGSLGMTGPDVVAALEKAARKPYAPVTIAEDIDKEKALMLEEASFDMCGLVIATKAKRHYAYGNVGCHIFGYLSEITENELDRLRDYGYRIKDLLGRDGLEKYYDAALTGVDGGLQIEVDNKGRQVRTLGLKEPSNGKDLYLTIDMSMQALSDKLLGERKGVVIVMDPRNGEVLALASHPTFDPNLFVKPDTSAQRMKLLGDRIGRPLLNRAISCIYPPGSVFKIVIASAALETLRIKPSTRFFCGGSYVLGKAKFNCWKDTGHGLQDVVSGLMNSCNVFFYNTGKATGVDNIEMYAKLFGFGKPAGIDLPDEAMGIVPGKLWKKQHRKDKWYEGDTINYSIGQGYLLVTPLQVVDMIAVIANGGGVIRPHIVKRIDAEEINPTSRKNIGIRNDVMQKVREGLYKVVNDESGTAKHVRVKGVAIAAKTGTAQNPQGKTHAWFTGFAPFNAPKICVVVFLEHGGHGGLVPADIARGIFEEAKNKGYL